LAQILCSGARPPAAPHFIGGTSFLSQGGMEAVSNCTGWRSTGFPDVQPRPPSVFRALVSLHASLASQFGVQGLGKRNVIAIRVHDHQSFYVTARRRFARVDPEALRVLNDLIDVVHSKRA
jgi:hypothetical protein